MSDRARSRPRDMLSSYQGIFRGLRRLFLPFARVLLLRNAPQCPFLVLRVLPRARPLRPFFLCWDARIYSSPFRAGARERGDAIRPRTFSFAVPYWGQALNAPSDQGSSGCGLRGFEAPSLQYVPPYAPRLNLPRDWYGGC